MHGESIPVDGQHPRESERSAHDHSRVRIRVRFIATHARTGVLETCRVIQIWNALFRAHFNVRNASLALFSLFTLILVLSISHILTRHEPVVFLLLLTGTYAAGVGIVIRLVFSAAQRVPRTPVWRISTVFTACLATLLAIMYLQQTVLTQIEVTTIHELSLSDPVTIGINVGYLLVVTVQSFAALGILAALIGIPIVLLDKIRGKSPYDQTG